MKETPKVPAVAAQHALKPQHLKVGAIADISSIWSTVLDFVSYLT